MPRNSPRKVTEKYNLQVCNPALAKEWHPTKNGPFTPQDATPGMAHKVWWICPKGHEYQAEIFRRSYGGGCSVCANRVVTTGNCLATVNPDLAKQWHPTKNGKLTPNDVVFGSHKKVWWLCKVGHEFQAIIELRHRQGTSCSFCNSKTSIPELRIYSELKYIFGNVRHRAKLYTVECDIYIPDLKIAIEFDGGYWHRNSREKDIKKTKQLHEKGITLIRIREKGLPKIAKQDLVLTEKSVTFNCIERVLIEISMHVAISEQLSTKIRNYIHGKQFRNEIEFLKLLDILPGPLPGTSLGDLNQRVAAEWHSTKNGTLTPKNVSLSSHKMIWWVCSNGHDWQATVANRNSGNDCPYCANYKVCATNSLAIKNPQLSKEWHPTKNGLLTPERVMPGTQKKAWWLCSKGQEWQAAVLDRNSGKGCPYCSRRFASPEWCLATVNPKLAKEWHPIKNGSLTPNDVTPGSDKIVWWLCGNGHEWQTRANARSRGFGGCPQCRRTKRAIKTLEAK